MDLPDKRWTSMASMHYPRGGFTPCLFRSLFYLVSPYRSAKRSVETFDPESETFAVLPITIPRQLNHCGASVSFIFKDELCVFTGERQLLRWKVDQERKFRLTYTGEILWSDQQPLVVGSLLLIACCGGVDQFDLETFSYIKRVE